MAGLSITAVADDLTGAAEIAAIGHRYGLQAAILTRKGRLSKQPNLAVYDTDTRLLPTSEASQRLQLLGENIATHRPEFIYKKTDSVLRGNVAAEIIALARSLNLRRILLLPANPSLGRTTHKGQYFINGTPINETAFARDPHHPANSACIADLLGPAPDWPVSIIKPGDTLPEQGIIVGETSTSADVEHWASRLDPQTLPAGGAEFFEACLKRRSLTPVTTAVPAASGPILLITGALTPARQKLSEHAHSAGWPSLPMPSALAEHGVNEAVSKEWIKQLAHSLSKSGLTLTESPGLALDDHIAAEQIRNAFGELVRQLHAKGVIGHLIVEGGATSAAISEAVGWSSFDVLGSWAPGVISLRPTDTQQPVFTIKPGSYTWPEILWQQLDTSYIPAAKS